MTLDDACDFIITKVTADDDTSARLNVHKLHKLLYYAQAWHLAIHDRPLFQGAFQAWVHGPVSREIYDRFRDSKGMYSAVFSSDIRPMFNMDALSVEEQRFLETLLEEYAPLTGTQLEEMTHAEDPWKEARRNCLPSQRCEVVIKEETMRSFYRARLG